MERVKLSTLSKETIVLIEGAFRVQTVEDILDDIDSYRNEEIYTTTEHEAYFNAKEILDYAIDCEYENGMYEDWTDSIRNDITEDDIKDLQIIFDRILARNQSSNIAYEADKIIEFDI